MISITEAYKKADKFSDIPLDNSVAYDDGENYIFSYSIQADGFLTGVNKETGKPFIYHPVKYKKLWYNRQRILIQ